MIFFLPTSFQLVDSTVPLDSCKADSCCMMHAPSPHGEKGQKAASTPILSLRQEAQDWHLKYIAQRILLCLVLAHVFRLFLCPSHFLCRRFPGRTGRLLPLYI